MGLFSGKTAIEQVKEAEAKVTDLQAQVTDLTAKLEASDKAKVDAERAAEETKATADGIQAKLDEATGKIAVAEKAATDAKAALDKRNTEFDAEVSKQVAAQLRAAGHEPLPIKPEETPPSKPDANAGLTGTEKLRAIYRQQTGMKN